MMNNAKFALQPIPANFHDLLDRPLAMALATTLNDGTPQVTPVWFNYEDGYVFFNSAAGRLKDRAIRAQPYVALTIIDPENQYHWISIRGPVVEINDDQQVARAHINFLSKRYTGADEYAGPPDEVRIRYKLAPEHVTGW